MSSDPLPISKHPNYRPASIRVDDDIKKASEILGFELPTIADPVGFTFHYRRSEKRWLVGLKRGRLWVPLKLYGATKNEARRVACEYAAANNLPAMEYKTQ